MLYQLSYGSDWSPKPVGPRAPGMVFSVHTKSASAEPVQGSPAQLLRRNSVCVQVLEVEGFEPSMAGPEPAALPLGYTSFNS